MEIYIYPSGLYREQVFRRRSDECSFRNSSDLEV